MHVHALGVPPPADAVVRVATVVPVKTGQVRAQTPRELAIRGREHEITTAIHASVAEHRACEVPDVRERVDPGVVAQQIRDRGDHERELRRREASRERPLVPQRDHRDHTPRYGEHLKTFEMSFAEVEKYLQRLPWRHRDRPSSLGADSRVVALLLVLLFHALQVRGLAGRVQIELCALFERRLAHGFEIGVLLHDPRRFVDSGQRQGFFRSAFDVHRRALLLHPLAVVVVTPLDRATDDAGVEPGGFFVLDGLGLGRGRCTTSRRGRVGDAASRSCTTSRRGRCTTSRSGRCKTSRRGRAGDAAGARGDSARCPCGVVVEAEALDGLRGATRSRHRFHCGRVEPLRLRRALTRARCVLAAPFPSRGRRDARGVHRRDIVDVHAIGE